jgi:hypothetical protein
VRRLCELYPGIALQLRKKHGKTSVRVVEKCPDIPVAVVQYTNNTQNNTMRAQNNTIRTQNNTTPDQ